MKIGTALKSSFFFFQNRIVCTFLDIETLFIAKTVITISLNIVICLNFTYKRNFKYICKLIV